MSALLLPPPDIPLEELYNLLEPVTIDRSSSAAVFQNWGRTFTCRPSSVFRPENERHLELILELARREEQTVRAVGVGHSPSDLACTSGYMVQMNRLDNIIEVRRVTGLSYLRISIAGHLSPSFRSAAMSVRTPGTACPPAHLAPCFFFWILLCFDSRHRYAFLNLISFLYFNHKDQC